MRIVIGSLLPVVALVMCLPSAGTFQGADEADRLVGEATIPAVSGVNSPAVTVPPSPGATEAKFIYRWRAEEGTIHIVSELDASEIGSFASIEVFPYASVLPPVESPSAASLATKAASDAVGPRRWSERFPELVRDPHLDGLIENVELTLVRLEARDRLLDELLHQL